MLAGKYTVPVFWDKKTSSIVNNECASSHTCLLQQLQNLYDANMLHCDDLRMYNSCEQQMHAISARSCLYFDFAPDTLVLLAGGAEPIPA